MWSIRQRNNLNFSLAVAGLTAIAVFVPERYSILVFLGAIFVMLFEIGERIERLRHVAQEVVNNKDAST